MKNELKTIQHIWTIICEQATVDPITNSISLRNAIDEAQISGRDPSGKTVIPTPGTIIPLNFQIVSLWKRVDGGDREIVFDGQLEIIDPMGKTLSKQSRPIKIEQGKIRARDIVQFNALQITHPGDYLFRTSVKDPKGKDFIEVAENDLTIRFLLQSQPGTIAK